MRGSLRSSALLAAAALLVLGASLAPVTDAPVAAPSATPPLSVAPALAASTGEAPGAVAATPAPSTTPGGPIPSGYRLTIPRLGIDLPIAEGDIERDVEAQRTPEHSAFHLPGTSLPGQAGNTYLYAHARPGMFLALWSAHPGDLVVISAPDGLVFAYVVSEVLPRVPPRDVSPAQPTSEERLTLQTSTGPAPSDPRFVVLALPRG